MSANLTTRVGGLLASAVVRTWMASLDFKATLYDPSVDPTDDGFVGPVIGVMWHEYLLTMLYLRGHTNTAILTSRHRDAEWLAQAASHLGFDTIRGSTFNGGTQAMLEFIRHYRDRNLGVACDGPRGPRRRFAQGPIYLSSKLQIPLVAYGIGYQHAWRMPTWDQFAVPRPRSNVRLVVSPRIQIPPGLDREGVSRCQHQVEQLLDRLTFEAETWASQGTRRVAECSMRRKPMSPLAKFRVIEQTELFASRTGRSKRRGHGRFPNDGRKAA